MNHLADPQKKTSIGQLLNPLESVGDAAYHNGQVHSINDSAQQQVHHDHHGVPAYPPQYSSNPSSFNLRAANWEMPDDSERRKPDNVATATRQYQHIPQMNGPGVYGEQPARMVRPRMEAPNGYPIEGQQVWQQPQDMQAMQYGPPSGIAPMYSDERTAISGDYPPQGQHNYHPGYSESSAPPGTPEMWQTAQRASVRLAARGTMPPAPQDPRYHPQQYYQPGIYAPMPYFTPEDHAQTHSMAQKRSAPDSDDTTGSKQKKTKSRAKSVGEGGPGPSRRGYNAKKRSEAAQIAAQNAQLIPTVSYVSDKGKEKASEGASQDLTPQNPTSSSAMLTTELQFARCMSNRYRSEQFPRCVSCTRRWAGDTCRFQGIRFFLKDQQRNIVGISFVESQTPDAPSMNFPTQWNISLKPEHIRSTKLTVARALLPTLRKEMKHLELPEVIRRPRESEVRATCDTCMTSIFSSTWMCRLCGREACEECYEQVKDLTMDRPGAGQTEIAALQARREKHAHSNPFFLSCTRRNEHTSKEFSPVSRFCKEELAQAIAAMDALVKEDDANQAASGTTNVADGAQGHQPPNTTHPNSSNGLAPQADATNAQEETPSHDVTHLPDDKMTDEIFRSHWMKGEPLVVNDVLSKFRIEWTPEYFIEKYGGQNCLIIECQTEENKRTSVAEFFKDFGKYEGRKSCWKLKDWPSSTEFKAAFPDLYEDFASAVPVPNYVRRDGVMNIASHFPYNTISPDLGPKMYNAYTSTSNPGSKGTTRLHMDMSDAVNIMTYAAPTITGEPGYAAWDLFRSQDSDKLRQFLRKRFKGAFQNDPIHAQQFYLDEQLRRELWETAGVKSFRIYQRPGQAVFIPAGCAHQVVNLADCVKVAIDFVSPENIARCEQLTREFREQNQSMVWKEDVLQLRTMMWFAWLSCCRQEQ
ncbi:hypothetical protein EYR40_005332 [Pleurotus pulmonarius]|nr:hypothetical protein EYR40_005332 [Pleurotus pulmonarius]